MAARLRFELTTPERVVLKVEADGATVPTESGEITVLPGHIPLVSTLRAGMITLHKDGEEEYLAVSGGFVEVRPGNVVIILADAADRAEDLDLQKVEAARERARALLEEKRHVDDVGATAAIAALEHELARIKVLHKHRSKRGAHLPE